MRINEVTTKEAIMLIGMPGSGKSTWIKNFLAGKDPSQWAVISTDDILERWGSEKGLTYAQAFSHFNFKHVKNEMFKELGAAIKAGKNVIFDQTNMTAKSRAEKLKLLPADYSKKAIVWSLPEPELKRRAEKRHAETGKLIPPQIVASMARTYVAPTKAEGFNKITYINS